MIKLTEVCKSFSYGKTTQNVLNKVDLNIDTQDFITIMGKSGSGKTTLLNCIALLTEPSSGEIFFNNNKVNFDKQGEVDSIRRAHYGLVFQNANLISCLTPLENVVIAMNSNEKMKDKKARAIDLIQQVGLGDKLNVDVRTLSGGEAQRVSIVRALINNPDVLLCDEPTGALDNKNSDKIIELLLDLRKRNNCSLVMVTHDANIGALGIRKLKMEEGQIYEL